MQTGISLYPGLEQYDAPFRDLIATYASYSISRIFTSLHIPETDAESLRRQLQDLLQAARQYDMDVIADVSPTTQDLLSLSELSPSSLLALGITTARLDYGFTVAQTALWSRVMKVQLNASTIQPAYLDALAAEGADFTNIDSLHNFYPRPNTGLSDDFFRRQTALLHDRGIPVGAFIPSLTQPRGPLYEGLPTLEADRTKSCDWSSRHVALLGADSIFIGDAHPSIAELEALQAREGETKHVVVLTAQLLTRDWQMQDFLSHTFTSRLDEAADVIRAQESRALAKAYPLTPDRTVIRPRAIGDITVDNTDFLRYAGELQIIKRPLPYEKRTNIVARIVPEDIPFLPYLTPGTAFRFRFL